MAFHNSLHDWKAETTAFAAGRKHGVEDPGHPLFRNSWSGILDPNENIASGDSPFQAHSPVRGSLAKCVQNQIQQHPVQQLVVSDDRAIRIAFGFNSNFLLLGYRLKKFLNA